MDEFPEEYTLPLPQDVDLSDPMEYYKLLKDKTLSAYSRTYLKWLINGRYGQVSGVEENLPLYDPALAERITKTVQDILSEYVGDLKHFNIVRGVTNNDEGSINNGELYVDIEGVSPYGRDVLMSTASENWEEPSEPVRFKILKKREPSKEPMNFKGNEFDKN